MTKKKNFLITGATSALGKSLAFNIKRKYSDNTRLFLISRSYNKELDELTDSQTVYKSGIDLLQMDPNNEAIKEIDSFFEGEFSLIHSAGDFWNHLTFLEFSSENARKMMDSHYGTFYNVLQIILPIMIRKGGGKILTFTCNATDYHFPNMLPFTAAKAAVDATIKCIAHEYANKNIVANSIALSSLKTRQNKDSKPFGDYEHYLDLKKLSDTVIEITELSNNLANGNVINCYEYSDSYYNEGYFQRIRQK